MGTPWPDTVKDLLYQGNHTVLVSDSITPNPRASSVDSISNYARENEVEIVIGLGGGSVLDAAKAVAMLINNPGPITQYEGKNLFRKASAPFIAIPTTCGTGSEVTWVSVITHNEQKRKMSIKGEGMFPYAAIVDADVLRSLPSHLIASTAMDAMTHAIEAYIGNKANPVSDNVAEQAIKILFHHLEGAVSDDPDHEAYEQVMLASTLAGMAFGNADVGGVHCLSESLGGYFDVPHGLTNALLLLPVLREYGEEVHPRLSRLEQHLSGGNNQNAEAFLCRLEALIEAIHLPPFSRLGIAHEAYPDVAKMAEANNSNSSNPKPMQARDYLNILERIENS